MPTFNFTATAIGKAIANASNDKAVILRDATVKGLVIRIHPGGKTSWGLEKRINTKLERATFYDYLENPDINAARKLAIEYVNGVRTGKHKEQNHTNKAMNASTLDWWNLWSPTVREKTAKDCRNDIRYLGLEQKPLLQLAKHEVTAIYNRRIQQVSNVSAGKEFRTIRLLWNFAAKTLPDGYELPTNPVSAALGGGKGTQNKLQPKIKRTRFIPTQHLPEFVRAIRQIQQQSISRQAASYAAEFITLTGLRLSEVTELLWSEIDLKSGFFIINIGRSKNNHPLRRYLTPRLREIILIRLAASNTNTSPYVFTSDSRNKVPIYDCQDILESACDAIGHPRVTAHDLRRSYSTACRRAGVDVQTAMLLQNHLHYGQNEVHFGYSQVEESDLIEGALRVERAIINGL